MLTNRQTLLILEMLSHLIRNSSKPKLEKTSNSTHKISNESENTSFQTFKPSQEYSKVHHNKNGVKNNVSKLTAPKITSPKPSLSKPNKNSEPVLTFKSKSSIQNEVRIIFSLFLIFLCAFCLVFVF